VGASLKAEMDNFLNRQAHETQPLSGFFARILHWLVDLVQWTEEEQVEAGIYLGDQDSREYLLDTTIVKNTHHT